LLVFFSWEVVKLSLLFSWTGCKKLGTSRISFKYASTKFCYIQHEQKTNLMFCCFCRCIPHVWYFWPLPWSLPWNNNFLFLGFSAHLVN